MFHHYRELGKLPRELWSLFFISLVNRAGTMALPFLVLYLNQHLSFTIPQAGLVMAAYGLGSLAISPVAGWLSDRYGPFPVMRCSLLASAFVMMIYPYFESFPALVAMTALWAAVNDVFRPAALTAAAELVPPAQQKPAYALVRLAINLGMSIGPAIGGVLAHFSFPLLFRVNGVTTALAALLAIFARVTPRPKHEPRSMFSALAGSISDRRLLYFLLAALPLEVVFFQHESTLGPFLVNDLRLPTTAFGLIFTINTLLICLLELPLNLSTAHWSHRRNLTLGALLVTAGFGGLAVSHSFGAVVVMAAVWTFGEMVFFPQAQAYLAELAPPGQRGAYIGWFVTGFSVALLIGPAAGTYAYAHFGAKNLWLSCLVAGLLSALALYLGIRAASGTPEIECAGTG